MKQMIAIQKIEFNNFNNEVLLKAEITKENLTYPTTLLLHQQDLNRLINLIQIQNEEIEVLDLMQSDELEDMVHYKLELYNLNNSIDWSVFSTENHFQYRQIRA
jgi:hypothetical protein